jgi:hypothetical protein
MSEHTEITGFLHAYAGCVDRLGPLGLARVHEDCNVLLRRLRRGRERAANADLRRHVRLLRFRVAARLPPEQSASAHRRRAGIMVQIDLPGAAP